MTWWFIKRSWRYLGCDRGTGRWRARWHYITGLPSALRTFRRLSRQA